MTEKKFDINFTKNFSRNVLTNIINIFVSTVIGLLLVPFFLDTLGTSAYALIPLATSLTSYVTLFIDSLNATVGRYLTIELQRDEKKKANETYNTSYILLLGFIAICIPIVVLISCVAPRIFDIGSMSFLEVQVFFALILGSTLVSTLKSNMMAILFAHNRLDLRNIVTISQLLVQVGLIIFSFMLFGASLTAVGTAYMIAAIFSLIMAYIFARKQTDALHFSLSAFNKHRIKEFTSLSLFVIFDRLGCVLQAQIALIVVNIYFGSAMQAEYSLVLTWGSFLVSLGGILTNTAAPMVYSLTGKNNNAGIIHFVSKFTKIVGLLIALPIALLCIYSPQLMTLWVGEEFADLMPLVWILLPVYYFTITLSCQASIGISHNRMKIPALLNIVAGGIYLGLALLLPKILDNGYYGVAIAYVLTIGVLHGIIGDVYYMYVLHGPKFTFLKHQWFGFGIMALLMVIGFILSQVLNMNSPLIAIASATLISLVYLAILVKLLLTKEEKTMAKACLPKAIQDIPFIQKL